MNASASKNRSHSLSGIATMPDSSNLFCIWRYLASCTSGQSIKSSKRPHFCHMSAPLERWEDCALKAAILQLKSRKICDEVRFELLRFSSPICLQRVENERK